MFLNRNGRGGDLQKPNLNRYIASVGGSATLAYEGSPPASALSASEAAYGGGDSRKSDARRSSCLLSWVPKKGLAVRGDCVAAREGLAMEL